VSEYIGWRGFVKTTTRCAVLGRSAGAAHDLSAMELALRPARSKQNHLAIFGAMIANVASRAISLSVAALATLFLAPSGET